MRGTSSGCSAILFLIADASLSFISEAAAFVNVTTSISSTLALPSRMILIMRSISTEVLPEPAAADTSTDLSSVFIAFSCSPVNPYAMIIF